MVFGQVEFDASSETSEKRNLASTTFFDTMNCQERILNGSVLIRFRIYQPSLYSRATVAQAWTVGF
jgi:hypothetical protein